MGLPLTAALVLTAAPLSEPPPRSSLSALRARMTAPAVTRTPSSAPPAAAMTPKLVAARRAPGGGRRGVKLTRARAPLAPRSMAVVTGGVERIEIQSP